ncbi:MAG: phosphoglycerate dehydrogenase [Fimbriimonadaceae bacterium]
MKVLVADKLEQSALEGLKDIGSEVDYQPDLKEDALVEAIHKTGAEILVVRSTKVTEPMMEGSRLSLIIRAGAGYNTIDVDAASRLGIYVSNCPGKNSQAVAELAFGLILAIDRHIPDNVIALREGRWDKKSFSKAKGLYGRTLGLVGMGKIGQEMVERAEAFGMSVVAYSRWMTPDIAEDLGIEQAKTPEDLATESDIVSVHVALTPKTKGMLGESFFNSMRPGATFINTSRAEVVDQAALEKALTEKKLFAGLDVFVGEPTGPEGSYDGSLKDNPRVYCTHHIGASTEQAQEAVAAETVRIVWEYMNTGMVPNVVNVSKTDLASHLLVVRHADKVGVLAHVLNVLKDEGVNVQEMENIVLGGAKAAIAQIALDKEPTLAALGTINENANIFGASVLAMNR